MAMATVHREHLRQNLFFNNYYLLRVLLRDSFSGVLTLINVINSAIFGPNSPPMDKGVHEVCTAKKSSGECDGGDGDSAGKVGDSSAAAAGGDDGDGESTEPIKDLKT